MKIYCSGIGGIGLSAYAALKKAEGQEVLGSDRSESALIDDLRSQGISVTLDQSGEGIPIDTDLLVYSEAIPRTAPERMRAEDLGIVQKSYPQALGELSKSHTVIAVCGTHGKSSTTAMANRMLMENGKDPTTVVGTKVKELDGKNWRKGKSDLFLLEACEYRGSFMAYSPKIILMTNCDGDHFDYYGSPDEYQKAFVDFLSLLPDDGIVITHMSDPQCKAVVEKSGKRFIDADAFPSIELKTPGKHMQENAKLVLALGSILEIPLAEAKKLVSSYAGSWRRMEEKGFYKDIPVIDDYGHHPVEIQKTLLAIKEANAGKRLVCVFQPHTHDRTLKLYNDFIRSFESADVVIIPDIYNARHDIETDTVDVKRFVENISSESKAEAFQGGSLKQTETLLKEKILKSGDVLVCMGAGDVTELAGKMIQQD